MGPDHHGRGTARQHRRASIDLVLDLRSTPSSSRSPLKQPVAAVCRCYYYCCLAVAGLLMILTQARLSAAIAATSCRVATAPRSTFAHHAGGRGRGPIAAVCRRRHSCSSSAGWDVVARRSPLTGLSARESGSGAGAAVVESADEGGGGVTGGAAGGGGVADAQSGRSVSVLFFVCADWV